MKVMVFVKANEETEAGEMPAREELAEMGAFNEELVKAGVMLDGEGLHPARRAPGSRSRRAARRRSPTGRSPRPRSSSPATGSGRSSRHGRGARVGQADAPTRPEAAGEVELRPVFEAEDFGEEFTPELREQEERLRNADRRRAEPSARPGAEGGRPDVNRVVEAVWRIESARLIAGLARTVRDVGLAEDLAQEALVAALEQWPESGVPDNPGAWLMATAKHRGIDRLRRARMAERKHEELGRELESPRRRRRAGPRRRARRPVRRRPAPADLHGLPPGALDRRAGGADPAPARRADDRRRSPAPTSSPSRRSPSASSAPSGR